MANNLPPGVELGPDGKFVSADQTNDFDDVEQWTTALGAMIPSGSLPTTGETEAVEALKILDFDDILDRDETASLLRASIQAIPEVNWNDTNADPDIYWASVEVGSASTMQTNTPHNDSGDATTKGNFAINPAEPPEGNDTLDLVGRPLRFQAQTSAKDTTNTLGSGGFYAGDEYHGGAADPIFHARDELFANVTLGNTDEASGGNGLGVHIGAQFLFGVES